MCGIAGLIWADRSRPAGREEIARMAHALYHRGPDDGGILIDGAVALAHRRLSIIDLTEGGHQPMVTADQRHAIVFNGEIYNFVELRTELQALGCRFQTESDTEVILHAYRTWGRACVSRFNGMWAFALLDRAAGEVFLSRDRFGIKPLYYVFDGARFAFASEIKGLLAGLPELRRSSAAMLHHFMPSGALDDGPETFFENVLALPAAHNMVLRLDAWSGAVERYWELDRTAFADRWMSPDPVGRLRELLDSSVKLHMRSDVPVGTCLSGGVDSSALVCLMSQQHPEPIHTFSGLYPDRDCDELPWVEAVRKHTGCVGHDIRPVPNGDLLDDLRSITWHQDEPSAGPGLYTQYHVMRRASQNVKVILDGQGGDELFAGYLPYLALRANDLFAQHGLSPQLQAWRLVASMAQHTNLATLSGVGRVAPMVRALTGLHRRLHRPAQGIGNEPPFFHPGLAARAAGHELRRERPVRLPDGLSDTLYWHTVQQSIPALLHYEDRNSMAFSIEARVPFLDYRVVEFALALDPSWKIRDTWTKWVLRKSVSDIVPPSVAWRRSKLGYPTPFARWLRDPREGDRIREVLFSRSFLDREVMTRESLDFYWNQHQAGVADRSWLLYRCVTLELWHQMYIDRFEPATAVAVPASSAVRTVELAA